MHENRWGMGSFRRARHAEMNLGLSAPFRVIPTDDFEYKYMITQWRTEPIFEDPFANVLQSTFHSFIPALAQLWYIPTFPAALLVADGVHVVGPRHVGPQALGCFIGHLDPMLQDRHGKPAENSGASWECLRMILGSNSNIKLVFVLWLKSNYIYICVCVCIENKYIYIYVCIGLYTETL